MKINRTDLSARYLSALRAHLGSRNLRRRNQAQSLGRAALGAGLVTLDLAIMHEKAVVALAASHDFTNLRNGALKRAGVFFTQALVPLEEAHQATRKSNDTLRLHTAALARGNRRLEREIARRQAAEADIRKGKEHYQKLFLESQVMQRKFRQLTRQMISAQEEERKEISRELHDEVVQTLVGINVALAALSKEASLGRSVLKAKVVRAQRLVENSVRAVHRFARELRPAVLDDLGLIPALHAYSKNLAARKKLKINLAAFNEVETLDIAKRTVLFRVAQEALTNVVRHAHATRVSLTISKQPGAVRMEIADDGRSFLVTKTLRAGNPKRLGLVGMKERIEMVGGTLVVESTPGHGTTVRAEIPFSTTKATP